MRQQRTIVTGRARPWSTRYFPARAPRLAPAGRRTLHHALADHIWWNTATVRLHTEHLWHCRSSPLLSRRVIGGESCRSLAIASALSVSCTRTQGDSAPLRGPLTLQCSVGQAASCADFLTRHRFVCADAADCGSCQQQGCGPHRRWSIPAVVCTRRASRRRRCNCGPSNRSAPAVA